MIAAAPRHLLVHVKNDHIDLWLLAAHAPHSGTDRSIREDWWLTITELIQRHAPHEPLVVMIDANATVGQADGVHVVTSGDIINTNTVLLREFLNVHELFIPSSTTVHCGERATWISPNEETSHCIDYVLLPHTWRMSCTWSENLSALDFSHLGDHQATATATQWTGVLQFTEQPADALRFEREDISFHNMHQALSEYKPPPWTTDIETQVDQLNDFLLQSLRSSCPSRRQRPKKSFITDDIWQCRKWKLRSQRRRRDQKRRESSEILAHVFRTWKTMRSEQCESGDLTFLHSLRICMLRTGAELWSATRQLRRSLGQAKSKAIAQTINELPSDCAASKILHKLKPIIGTTNPKMRKSTPLPLVHDEEGIPCATPKALIDRWVAFFSVMEGGERITQEDLRSMWIEQLAYFKQEHVSLQPEDLPTLTDLEIAFRRVKKHKAIGEDRVPPELCHECPVDMARLVYGQLLKLCVHGQEALLHKGGVLVAAWKRKGSQKICESYRSLLISSHVAKSIHRAVRDHQASVYEAFLQREQIGGRRSIPVSMGVHFIRAAARSARSQGRSHALISLDLREAFYRVLRPLSVGGSMPDALLAQVAARLQLPEDALAELHTLLQTPCGTEQANMPVHMRRALHALHTNTHFRVPGQHDRVHTRIGSRPGDPFADLVFGFMFSRVLALVEQRLAAMGLLESIEDVAEHSLFPTTSDGPRHQHTVLGPTWMDDLCLTVSGESALAVEHKTGVVASVLLETCTTHGVTPNLDKGKSEILFSFRGAGSRKLRTKYFSAVQNHQMPIITEYGTQHVSVVGQYTHLGNIAHHTGVSHREIRKRLGIGHAAFNAHRRLLFQNRSFTQQRRGELYLTLVYSKMSYSMESWVFEDKKMQNYFRSATLRLYRRLLKSAPDCALTDDEIAVAAQLPMPEIALRVSRLRYLGLLYKCENVTPWALLRADTGWRNLIAEDLHWMWTMICRTSRLRDPGQHFAEWESILRFHRSYWKRLLQRCLHLTIKQQADQLLIRKFHRDAFSHLERHGSFKTAPIRPALDEAQQEFHFGCMMCSKRCRTKAGEGAHLFRAHGIVAQERKWIATTQCSACLKEFFTFDRLQVHLRTARACRQVLNARPMPAEVQPGIGSLRNEQMRDQHDGLLPAQQALGPRELPQLGGEIDKHHVPLYEHLVLQILDHEETDERGLFLELKHIITTYAISWTQLKLTLHYLQDTLTDEVIAETCFTRRDIQQMVFQLQDPQTWDFLQEVVNEVASGEHLHSLDLYEQWCCDVESLDGAWTPNVPSCPRKFFKEKVILHAYSGRRRPGDVQWFIDHLAQQRDLSGIVVVSLDIVIDERWGDISRPDIQTFWLDALRAGFVLGMLSGPPCCTWSVARGKQDASILKTGKRGPRIVRTAQDLWGLLSVSLREMSQLHDGHLLLCFSLLAMLILSTTGGIGVLEHPGEPTDPLAASIWRLPFVKMLLALPDFQLFECAQGLLGADSAKCTGLLTLRMPSLPLHFRCNALCPELPRTGTIGVDEKGRFRTAKLKEYPPAMCKALAECIVASFPLDTEDLDSLPQAFLTTCQALHCTEMGTAIGADCVVKR